MAVRAKSVVALLGGLAVLFARAALAADAVYPVTVSAVTGNDVAVTYLGKPGDHGRGDGVCLYRGPKAVGCGFVLAAEDSDLTVRLTRGSNEFRRGELLRAKAAPKFANAEATEHALNLSLGARLYGPSSVYPAYFGKLHYVLSRRLALGAEVFFASADSGNLTTVGGFLFGTYYFHRMFRGVFAGGAIGGYSIHAKTAAGTAPVIEESAVSPAVRGLVGYRWIFGTVFNLGLEGGAQVLFKTTGDQLKFGYGAASVYGGAEFGWMF